VNRCGAPVSAPHSSVFARLASGAFYETIASPTFYEIIRVIVSYFHAIKAGSTRSREKWRGQKEMKKTLFPFFPQPEKMITGF
jgi:hypothetical protein